MANVMIDGDFSDGAILSAVSKKSSYLALICVSTAMNRTIKKKA